VPTQLRRLLDAGPATLDALRSYTAVLLGGAAPPAGLVATARAAGVPVVVTYGMSETCGGCVYDGVPLDGVSVDPGRSVIGSGSAGRCWRAGYRLRPELSRRVFAGGRFVTGDAGRLAGGRLTVLGRADDVLVTGGEKVAPAAVADALAEHPAVAEAAVVGVADPDWGQRVVAVVVLRAGAGLTLARRGGTWPGGCRGGGAAGAAGRSTRCRCWPPASSTGGRCCGSRGDDRRPVDRGRPAAHAAGRGRARARRHRRRGRRPATYGSAGRCSRSSCRWRLQVAVNYANDYSDGIRGTDTQAGRAAAAGRAPGVSSPAAVKRAALAAFAVGRAAGLVLAALTTWWLLAIGAAAMLAAWFYTGGSRPYGYRALGELSVFVFFGLVATIGTAYVQVERVTPAAVAGGVGCGALACALLVVNNLRDIPTDSVTGKRTLAVVLGDRRTRLLYPALVAVAFLVAVALVPVTRWTLLTLAAVPLAARPVRTVTAGRQGRDLVPALRDTGRLQLAFAVLLAVALFLA
jgi:1,4-dihydroxy-2-naphthoate octaprenyltransferase